MTKKIFLLLIVVLVGLYLLKFVISFGNGISRNYKYIVERQKQLRIEIVIRIMTKKALLFLLSLFPSYLNAGDKIYERDFFKDSTIRLIYFDFQKDLDLELVINKNGTFELRDLFGSQQMRQEGTYHRLDKKTLLLIDTTLIGEREMLTDRKKYNVYEYNSKYLYMDNQLFSSVKNDSLQIVDYNHIVLKGFVFEKIDHDYTFEDKIRLTEEHYKNLYGKKTLKKMFGYTKNRRQRKIRSLLTGAYERY